MKHIPICGTLLIAILIPMMLIGCASVAVSDSFTYRPANWEDTAWSISGRAEVGAFSDEISILINNEKVAGGTLSVGKMNDNFTGEYEGRKILAECELVEPPGDKLSYDHECSVFVDNERAAKLDF